MNVHDQVLSNMLNMADQFSQRGVNMTMPPKSNITLGIRYTEIEYGKMLAAEVPFDTKFTNPLHMFQGGFLCAALDDVFGPLTYMACGTPVVTIEMSTTFHRPFTAKDERISIRAEVVSRSKSLLVLKAEARNQIGKLIATSTSHSLVATEESLKARGNDSEG